MKKKIKMFFDQEKMKEESLKKNEEKMRLSEKIKKTHLQKKVF